MRALMIPGGLSPAHQERTIASPLAAALEASMTHRVLTAAVALVLLSLAGCASERANTYSTNPSQGHESGSAGGGGGMGGGY